MGETSNIGSAIKRRIGFRGIAKVRSQLNKLSRGRVGLYSTAEHYSDGPATKIFRYYQYDDAKEISCSKCGWKGPGRQGAQHMFDELLDVRCPSCGTMLLIIGYPTFTEIKEAAKRGNEEAKKELRLIRDVMR